MRELAGAVAGAVVGEQGAYGDAVAGEELDGGAPKIARGLGPLIGQHLGEGQPGVIVHGYMQGHEARMLALAAQAPVATQADLGKARHSFDVEV